MTKKVKFKNSKIFANNWVITLTATLIGVFAALYLNEWVSSKKLRNQKTLATKNILTEINSNQNSLETSIRKHTDLLETMEFLIKYVDEEDRLISPVDSMNKFRTKYPEVVTIKDSTLLENGNCEYNGAINIDLSIPHIQLTSIAWKTLKNSGISTTYNFECLMYLETIDKLTDEVLQKDEELIEFMTGLRDGGTKNENLISHLNLLIDYEESLLEIYKPREDELKDCN